jgi:diguanylate cyclase (GGDEF)-like protein
MFTLSMITSAWRDPTRFPPLIEMFHFVFVATVLPVVALLAGQLSQVRSDLRRQKGELREALARLSEIATRDELTGLPNRRHMQDWIAHEFARSHRHGAALCLAVIDLDHFKRVNDLHGHAVGDEGLRIFAREARKSLRDVDLIARWGGEEFLLAMPDTTEAGAARVLERLRQRLADPQAWAACPQARVTFSAGLATHGSAESVEDTVRRADDALYAAKRQGRDRVVSG